MNDSNSSASTSPNKLYSYKSYSKEIWDQINKSLEMVRQLDSQPVAAFDADGTLWDTDLGESFFDHLIDHKLVDLPSDPWQHYNDLKKDPAGPEKAYLWLGQILKGQRLETVRTWAQNSVDSFNPLPIFPEQRKLIDLFLKNGVQVFIVTASVKWAVEPGALQLGLDFDHVLGIETQVQNGIVTDQQHGIITYREGKSKALLSRTGGKKPFFSSGNTLGDKSLLEHASHFRMAVTSTQPDDPLFRSEHELQTMARALGWPTHRF